MNDNGYANDGVKNVDNENDTYNEINDGNENTFINIYIVKIGVHKALT